LDVADGKVRTNLRAYEVFTDNRWRGGLPRVRANGTHTFDIRLKATAGQPRGGVVTGNAASEIATLIIAYGEYRDARGRARQGILFAEIVPKNDEQFVVQLVDEMLTDYIAALNSPDTTEPIFQQAGILPADDSVIGSDELDVDELTADEVPVDETTPDEVATDGLDDDMIAGKPEDELQLDAPVAEDQP
jgi:hypothetical protein